MMNKKVPIVAFANQKGGVGKTTIVLQMTFQALRDKRRVLVIDFDPQGNTSTRLKSEDLGTENVSTARLYESPGRSKIKYENIFATESGADLIFSNKNDLDLYSIDQKSLSKLLNPAAHLKEITPKYDIVIIDCPPTLGRNLLAALCIATHVVAPVEVSGFAVDGLEGLFTTFSEVQSTINPSLRVAGVVINKFNPRFSDHIAALDQLKTALGPILFDNYLTSRASVDSVNIHGIPIWKKRDYVASTQMRNLYQEIIERTKNSDG